MFAALAIGLSRDRRHRVATVGWVLVVDGAAIIALLKLGRVYAGRRIEDDALSQAVQGALARATSDLNAMAFWMMAYGVVVAAAAGALGSRGRRLTPAVARERFAAWVERRRATTKGTVALGVLGLLLGLVLIQDPRGNLELLTVGRRSVDHVPRRPRARLPDPPRGRPRWAPGGAAVGGRRRDPPRAHRGWRGGRCSSPS